jgi:6-pyruvoyltetrahydropterin/6-carboxytetrahydropterin synthase
MYTVTITRDFVAQHFLVAAIGVQKTLALASLQVSAARRGDPGQARPGDIVDIETNLEALVGYFRDKTLNEMPEFAGLNPSIEHFSRIVCQALSERIQAPTLEAITVRMWEHEHAWAAYRKELSQATAR